MQHGKSQAANEQFQQIRKSRDTRANAAVGRLFIDSGREKESIPYLERAVALDAMDAGVVLDLAYAVAFGQDDFARAGVELTNAERVANQSGDNKLLPEIESARRLLDEVTAPTRRGHGLEETGAEQRARSVRGVATPTGGEFRAGAPGVR